jgi:4-hydroxybenzoate polyprenyltransferase
MQSESSLHAPPSADKFQALLHLIRWDRPIGTLLLLWPTLWALWIAAGGFPGWKLLFIFVAGTFLMRSAGCIINDLADRNLDGSVRRTQARPLVTGRISVAEAGTAFVVLCLVALGLVLMTNPLTIALSVPAVLIASAYPLMKRITNLPQLVLGVAFSWGIPMAFAAATNSLPPALWLLFFGNLLWTVVYDTKYAMVDRADDLSVGIKSTAILFGDADRLIIGMLQVMTLIALLLAGRQFGLGAWYLVGLAAAALLFVYHLFLIRDRDESACFRAFLHNSWVGFAVFLGIVADFALPTF